MPYNKQLLFCELVLCLHWRDTEAHTSCCQKISNHETLIGHYSISWFKNIQKTILDGELMIRDASIVQFRHETYCSSEGEILFQGIMVFM